jgi:hypothetical protein
MIRKIQHHSKEIVMSIRGGGAKHMERHIVTTYWFLFIPIWQIKKLESSNM